MQMFILCSTRTSPEPSSVPSKAPHYHVRPVNVETCDDASKVLHGLS